MTTNNNRLPMPEGVGRKEKIDLNEFQSQILHRVNSAATLAELAKDYVLFNHGVLCVHSGLTIDPVTQFIIENNIDKHRLTFLSTGNFAIFDGISNFWNTTLLMVDKDLWADGLARAIDMTATLDKVSSTYFRALRQQLPIPDYLAIAKKTTLAASVTTVDIFAYGLDGNKCCYHFKPNKVGPFVRYDLVKDSPIAETALMYTRSADDK